MNTRILLVAFLLIPFLVRCTTKAELRREKELAELKSEVKNITGSKADIEVAVEELRFEISRLNGVLSEREQFQNQQFEILKKELEALAKRIQSVEDLAVHKETKKNEELRATYENAENLFKQKKYEEAIEILNILLEKNPKNDKAHFLLAETFFSLKEYSNAAIELNEFKKRFPKHELFPKAIYYQALCFKKLNKPKEARLFYKELLEKYPKSSFARLAKKEMK